MGETCGSKNCLPFTEYMISSPFFVEFVFLGLLFPVQWFGYYIALYNYWFHTRYTENTMAKIKRIKGHRMIYRTLHWKQKT
jgi:hypothetical protein